MAICQKLGCGKEATLALRFHFFHPNCAEPVVAYLNLTVCDEHPMPEAETQEFLDLNFETMCVGFEMVGKLRPDPKLTKWEWRPMEEARDFWKAAADLPQHKIRKN